MRSIVDKKVVDIKSIFFCVYYIYIVTKQYWTQDMQKRPWIHGTVAQLSLLDSFHLVAIAIGAFTP
jgi:hypothetical protein